MNAAAGPVRASGRPGGPPLVSSAISHRSQTWEGRHGGKAEHFRVVSFEFNRWRLRMVRDSKAFPSKNNPSTRGAVDSFSAKSQRRLREVAANADPALVSMFVATYADGGPKDGAEAKRHLDAFLKRLKRLLPQVGYLWVLEFQGAGNDHAPHFHVFLTTPRTDQLHRALANAWHEIAGNGCPKHLRVAQHPRSFITWDMGTGSYVAKYLDKARQKDVPEGYVNVGRFWGASRGLVPDPFLVEARELARALLPVAPKAVKQAVRWVCKWHEKHTRGRSFARRSANSYTFATAAPVFKQILRYFSNLPPDETGESPF